MGEIEAFPSFRCWGPYKWSRIFMGDWDYKLYTMHSIPGTHGSYGKMQKMPCPTIHSSSFRDWFLSFCFWTGRSVLLLHFRWWLQFNIGIIKSPLTMIDYRKPYYWLVINNNWPFLLDFLGRKLTFESFFLESQIESLVFETVLSNTGSHPAASFALASPVQKRRPKVRNKKTTKS